MVTDDRGPCEVRALARKIYLRMFQVNSGIEPRALVVKSYELARAFVAAADRLESGTSPEQILNPTGEN